MILCIILLILFLLLLVLLTFFTIYFIIPSIDKEKRIADAIIPTITAPQKLPRQRHITPSDVTEFVDSLIEPIPMEDKLKIMVESSFPKKSENNASEQKKHFKIWAFCYKILIHFM